MESAVLRFRPTDRPEQPRSTVLSAEEEAVVVAFRRQYFAAARQLPSALQPAVAASDALVPSPVSATPRAALEAGELVWAHAFEYACAQNDVNHRLTKPKHPWTNGQVERMNRTIKDATVKRYFYEFHDQLRAHLQNFVDAYNFARRLKTLRGLTPYEFICKAWT